MNTEDNKLDSKKMIYTSVLVVSALLIAALSSIPSFQNKLHDFFSQNNRNVLAKVSGFFGLNQTEFLILKIQDELGLQIEVYEMQPAETQVFRQKMSIAQDADAYITLDKDTTNLALSDVDKDGAFDIIAPSVDRNGNLRLNVFRYNDDLKAFEPYIVQN